MYALLRDRKSREPITLMVALGILAVLTACETNKTCDTDDCECVPVRVTAVSLDQKKVYMAVSSSSKKLVATVEPSDATNARLTWFSSNLQVATVSQAGEVTPVAEGTATIVVTTQDGNFADACLVTVSKDVVMVTEVSLNQKTLGIAVGSSNATLVATVMPENAANHGLIWSSSNPQVANVSQLGEVSPIAEGNATITVTTQDGGFTDTCIVTVVAALQETVAWVMSYFGPDQSIYSDSLHLAYSTDGLHWNNLNAGAPVYYSKNMGTNHIRDPFILRKQDNTFVYIATDWTRNDNPDYWSNPSPNIFVADSIDLITFTNPRLLPVTNLSGPNGSPMHAWAPEAYWDPVRKKYAILWSGNDTAGVNRIYVSYTDDFVTVDNPTPTVFFDPGYSVIDATLTSTADSTYLFFKDETNNGGSSSTGSGKDIQVARSSQSMSPGTFTRWDPDYITRGTSQSTRQGTEGPLVIKKPDEDRWYLYADYYANGGVFGCWTTTDLNIDPSQWTKLSSTEYFLPAGVRHANTVRVTQAELDALIDFYQSISLFRTNHLDNNGVPHYFAHSWLHGIITYLEDRSNGQIETDFYWRILPGLADPSNPDLFSVMPINQPGKYVRIDSNTPSRYPACDIKANRASSLCNVPEEKRNHLVWADWYEDTDTFRADATFRRVSALNANPSMVSFQWYQDPTRYLRHLNFHVFAHVPETDQEQDSSFTIEAIAKP